MWPLRRFRRRRRTIFTLVISCITFCFVFGNVSLWRTSSNQIAKDSHATISITSETRRYRSNSTQILALRSETNSLVIDQHASIEKTRFKEKSAIVVIVCKLHQVEQPVYVILLAYMRGGSTFASLMLEDYPSTFHWFEPVDAVYASLYGYEQGFSWALDILNTEQYIPRTLPKWEEDAVSRTLNTIFTCNLENLSAELLLNNYIMDRRSKSFTSYVGCLGSQAVSKQLASRCQAGLEQNCGKAFTADSENMQILIQCFIFIKEARKAVEANDMPAIENLANETWLRHSVKSRLGVDLDYKYMLKPRAKANFINYAKCLYKYKNVASPCLEKFQTLCQKSKVRSVKTIRLPMSMVGSIQKHVPNVKVIHLLRDPRGIISSRRKLPSATMSHLSGKCSKLHCLKKEAELLCRSMARNIIHGRQLEETTPGTVMTVTYEDLVDSHRQAAVLKSVYDFLGVNSSDSVYRTLHEYTHSYRNAGNFGTKRKNGAAAAYAWKKFLKPEIVTEVNLACSELLKLTPFYMY